MPKSFHLNGDALGFYPQTRKLKLKTVSVEVNIYESGAGV